MIPDMVDHHSTSPLEFLLRIPTEIAEDMAGVLPKLVDRSRSQVEFIGALLNKIGCGQLLSRSQAEHLAEVIPFGRDALDLIDDTPEDFGLEPHHHHTETSSSAEAVGEDEEDEDEGAEISVVSVTEAAQEQLKRSTAGGPPQAAAAATKAPAAKKAPAARKAPAAKKAPAARKAPAAKKAPAARKAPAAKKTPVTKAPAAKKALAAPSASSLAIVDYDSLAASQVVPRLEALTVAELESLRLYELAHRGRRTILSRVQQLQAS